MQLFCHLNRFWKEIRFSLKKKTNSWKRNRKKKDFGRFVETAFHVSREFFWGKVVFVKKINKFSGFFGILGKKFWDFWRQISARLSKLHSACPGEHFTVPRNFSRRFTNLGQSLLTWTQFANTGWKNARFEWIIFFPYFQYGRKIIRFSISGKYLGKRIEGILVRTKNRGCVLWDQFWCMGLDGVKITEENTGKNMPNEKGIRHDGWLEREFWKLRKHWRPKMY